MVDCCIYKETAESYCKVVWVICAGLSMNILHLNDKSPVQRAFFNNTAGDLLPALRFLSRLYNFSNFAIIFFLM